MPTKPKRYHVVKHSYYLVHELPGDWDENSAGFFYNESSHCADSEAQKIGLIAIVGEHVCATCGCHKAEPMAIFDTPEAAADWRDEAGNGPMERSPEDRLDRLKADGVLDEDGYKAEMCRLENIQALL